MKVKISKDFAYAPGPRYIKEGANSGELFRTTKFRSLVEEAISKNEILIVDLDGTAGYGRSFLEELFGGLVREDKLNYQEIVNHLEIISNEEPNWKNKISMYLKKAYEEESSKMDKEK
ncbi:MAG TPA: STAS-like domain-containing protein [Pyrinomonadaceae bacterium]|jgi:hypothetical protein